MSIRQTFLPELAAGLRNLTTLAAGQGVTFKIADYGGFRTQSDTTEILAYRDQDYRLYVAGEQAAGRTPAPINTYRRIAPYGQSYHDFGAAFDVEPLSIGGVDIHQTPLRASIWRTDPKRAQSLLEQATGVLDRLASSAGLRSGAGFNDPLHFELPVTLIAARAMWGNFQETGSSTGTADVAGADDVTGGGDIAGGADDDGGDDGGDDGTQQTTRSKSGSATIEILGAIAVAGLAVVVIRAIRGGA